MTRVEREKVEQLALMIDEAETIMVHSGDREPGARLTPQCRRWIVKALRLFAEADKD